MCVIAAREGGGGLTGFPRTIGGFAPRPRRDIPTHLGRRALRRRPVRRHGGGRPRRPVRAPAAVPASGAAGRPTGQPLESAPERAWELPDDSTGATAATRITRRPSRATPDHDKSPLGRLGRRFRTGWRLRAAAALRAVASPAPAHRVVSLDRGRSAGCRRGPGPSVLPPGAPRRDPPGSMPRPWTSRRSPARPALVVELGEVRGQADQPGHPPPHRRALLTMSLVAHRPGGTSAPEARRGRGRRAVRPPGFEHVTSPRRNGLN